MLVSSFHIYSHFDAGSKLHYFSILIIYTEALEDTEIGLVLVVTAPFSVNNLFQFLLYIPSVYTQQ